MKISPYVLEKGSSVFAKSKTDGDVSLKVCTHTTRVINGSWLLIIERERVQKRNGGVARRHKKPPPFWLCVSDTWGSHFQESFYVFWSSNYLLYIWYYRYFHHITCLPAVIPLVLCIVCSYIHIYIHISGDIDKASQDFMHMDQQKGIVWVAFTLLTPD